MNRRAVLALSSVAALGFGLLPGSAFSQQKSLKDQLVGTWTLVSAESAAKDGTKIPFIEGTNLSGLLVLDASGRISFQVMATLPKLASNDRLKTTPAEDKALAHGVLSYFGTYSVSEADHVLTLHIEHSSFANQVGLDAKRTVSFNTPDEVKITTPTSLAGNTNNLVWKRLK
jgi:hypothetical protein